MDFSKLNEVARLETLLPLKKLSDLEVYFEYRVSGVRRVKTKFGDKIVLDLEDSFTIFLPNRLTKALQEDEDLFQKVTTASKEIRLHLRYLGGPYSQLEFVYV